MSFKNQEEITKKYQMGGGWMNLEQGVNKIRIVSDFVDYGVHSIETIVKGGKKKFQSVVCIGKDLCEYCLSGDKAKVQFLGWVIDRKDGEVKLLRIGWKIWQQISALAENEDYGFETTPDYDITINKKGEGLNTTYSVIASRESTELTEEEKTKVLEKVKDPNDVIDSMKAKVALSSDEIEDKDIPVTEEPEEN